MIRRLSLVALLSALVITGCAARGVRIAELKDQPDRYDDKTVSVTGVVTSSWGPAGLRCHYCGHEEPLPLTCRTCANPVQQMRGVGT